MNVATSTDWKTLEISYAGGALHAEPAGWRDAGFDDSAWAAGYVPPDPPVVWEVIAGADFLASLAARSANHMADLIWIGRLEFTLASLPDTARVLRWTADNDIQIWINDHLVVNSIGVITDNTPGGETTSVPAAHFVMGDNCIAIKVTNDNSDDEWANNPAMGQLFISVLGEAGVAIDFDDDTFGPEDDVSAYVAGWIIQRGASAEITGGATVGAATITLKNHADDRFNPLNAAGPLYGKLRDGLPLWIGVNSDGAITGTEPRGLFGGRTTDITPLPVSGATYSPFVTIEAEDALGWYGRTPVRVADGIGRSYRALRELMLDDADETRLDLANEILTMPLSSFDGNLLDGLEAINKVNGTRHFCKPQDDAIGWYAYTTRNRQWRLDATVDASLDGAGDHLSTDGWKLSADTVTNQQKATVSPVSFTPSSTVVWQAEGLPYHVTSAADKVIWVEFDDFVDSPIATANYTGTAPTVTLEPFGNTAKLTIHSSGTTTITGLLIAGALAKRGNAVSALVDDAASQAGTRGIRAGSEISGDLVGVLANAQGIAAHIVWRYADPQFRPTATVVNWIPDQFEIDLSDIVSITVAELQMTSRLFEVVGLTHECNYAPDATKRSHATTYVLQECAVQADPGWFVLDTSELDSAAILAY